jgi:V/A-type H+-transporting ATPase subunit E
VDKVSELESAILERAAHLAEEYRQRAERSRDTILGEAHEHLHLREEREVLVAKAKAERSYRRAVQANELKLSARMDRLRWELVQCVHDRLAGRFEALVQDRKPYLAFLKSLLVRAAADIDAPTLVVELNRRDHDALEAQWEQFVQDAVPDREIQLGPECRECLGGLLIRTPDNRIRVDNTFEGRLRRLETQVLEAIVTHLLPQTPEDGFRVRV